MFEPTPVRFLAPVALVLAVVAVVIVVGAAEPTPKTPTAKAQTTQQRHTTKKSVKIRAGDTLAAIAARTGIPESVLRDLNPDIDPSALPIGGRIRLRR
jgi:LysM repeat protein